MDGKFIAYYRVSTDRQGRSGLGLEAQQRAVADYLNGGDWELIESFTEVESGRGKAAKRPQLAKALAAAKRHKATLVIAKLDRLARNVHFISGLMETKVPFVAADRPAASPFELHIYAAMSEEEGRVIAARTKAALAAAKRRGVKLGKTGKALAERHKVAADRFAVKMAPKIIGLQKQGFSIQRIADRLNADGVPTAKGANWHGPTVHRLIKRLEAAQLEDAG
jgi:DNA invertase Pin-like site-specific DNA recombinase